MASAMSVERSRERRIIFQCLCGTHIVTSMKTVTCANCGKTMEAQRVRTRRQRQHQEPSLWPLVFSMAATHRTRHGQKGSDYHQLFRRLESPNYNERCLRLGFLILLAPLWVPLLSILLIPMFAPLIPEQDRPHHYERHEVQVIDGRGGVHTIPTWKRVDD